MDDPTLTVSPSLEIRPAREFNATDGKLNLLELNFYKDHHDEPPKVYSDGSETEFWSQQRKKPKLDNDQINENSLIRLENYVNLEKNVLMVSLLFYD